MKPYAFILFFSLLLPSAFARAEQSAAGIRILRGVVVRQIHGCEVDGTCAIVIKTEKGEETLMLNQGMMPGSAASCSQGSGTANEDAFYLLPGDKVEIHVPVSSGDYLCGAAASVTRLNIPQVPLKIIHGIVVKQNRACIEQRPEPCSVVVKTPTGDEEILWGMPNRIGDFGPECRKIKGARELSGLKPNDEVEINLPLSSGNRFCGDGASLKLSPDAAGPPGVRIIEGIILEQKDGCREMSQGDGICSFTVQTEQGNEKFITAYPNNWHPPHCSFNQPMADMTALSVNDEVEIHIPPSSGDVICGSGAAVIRRTDSPLRARALAMKPGPQNADPAMRIVRGILAKTDSFGLLIETGTRVEEIKYRSFAGSGCRTSMGLVAQAVPFQRGDAIEVHIPVASADVLCGPGASLMKLN